MLLFDKDYEKQYDNVLTDLACNGNREALELFFSSHQDLVYNIALWMFNDARKAKAFNQAFMIKLLVNMRKARACGNVSLWMYRMVVEDISTIISGDTDLPENKFRLLSERVDKELKEPAGDWALQDEFQRKLEATKNSCLLGMASCLGVQDRFVFVLSGIFNIPELTVSEILQISVKEVQDGRETSKTALLNFIRNSCSLMGYNNNCTCEKRTSFHFDMERSDFYDNVIDTAKNKINKMIITYDGKEKWDGDDLIMLYRDASFFQANSTAVIMEILRPKIRCEGNKSHFDC